MAAIELRGVSKRYPNGRYAVRDVSLTIADRELLVLLGPSGSGKSTVLRLIAGLETPTGGEILIDGVCVNDVAPQDRDIAMVFQSYALYPHKTVRQNLAFGLRMRGLAAAGIDARVNDVAVSLGLDALLDRRPAQLSGGERQRVALGRAIVRQPRAFLLDEPLSNLDPTRRTATRAELALLHRRLAATMIHVTHDQEEAMTLGQRIAVMRDGALEQVAPPLEVYSKPVNTFVAQFIGTPAMNIWRDPSGGDVSIGIRPHDLDLVDEGGDLRGVVEVVEPLGATTILHVRGHEPAGDLLRAAVSPDRAVTIGAEVRFALRRDRLHLFDTATGQRRG